MTLREKLWFAWILFWLVMFLALTIIHISTSGQAQPFPFPRPEDWGPEEQRRILPERRYDPYDRGPEERYRRREGISKEEYRRRSYCVMHPRDCQ